MFCHHSETGVSTLRNYLEAVGGRLSLIVEFPDRSPCVLDRFRGEKYRPPGEKMRASQFEIQGEIAPRGAILLREVPPNRKSLITLRKISSYFNPPALLTPRLSR